MSNIIFLDIDGVLNTFDFIEKNPSLSSNDWIDPDKIQILNRLSKHSFVLSSDWRMSFDAKKIQAHLEKFGFVGKCIGCTKINNKSRFEQISDWIDENTDVQFDNFAIIDDMDVCKGIKNKSILKHFFKVDKNIGLTNEIVEEIIKFLKE